MSRLLTYLLSLLVVIGSVACGLALAFLLLITYLTLIGVPFA